MMQRIVQWYLRRLERHYMMCAELERRNADQAMENSRYYLTKATLVRCERL